MQNLNKTFSLPSNVSNFSQLAVRVRTAGTSDPVRLYSKSGDLISAHGHASLSSTGKMDVWVPDGKTYDLSLYDTLSKTVYQSYQAVDAVAASATSFTKAALIGALTDESVKAAVFSLGRSSSIGPIAGRTGIPNTTGGASNVQMQAQSQHTFTDYSSYIEVWWPTFYMNGGVETPCLGTNTGRASITYIDASWNVVTVRLTQVSDSAATATQVGGGYLKLSAAINPAPFTRFKLRFWGNFPGGMPYCQNRADYTNGDIFRYGTTTTDLTGTTTVFTDTWNGNGDCYQPTVILGNTAKRTLGIQGDSRAVGIKDTPNDTYGFCGSPARKFGPYVGYVDVSHPGALATDFTASAAPLRILALQQASDYLIATGVNDLIANSFTPEQVKAAWEASIAAVGRPAIGQTVGPWVTNASTNTLFNAARDPQRQAFNALIRSLGITGLRGFSDHASALEVPTTHILRSLTYTGDGVHENNTGNAFAASNGSFDFALLGNPAKLNILASA